MPVPKDIRSVHEADVRAARHGIREACRQASSAWIPRNAIADALILEFIEQIGSQASQQTAISKLKRLLRALKEKPTTAPLQ